MKTLKKIRSDIAGGAVFSLPWLVAKDEGLFAAEGLDVSLVRSPKREKKFPGARARPLLPSQVDSTGNHLLFEQGKAQFHRGCEWGQLRRAYDSTLGGRVVGKRAAIVTQAIIVRGDSKYVCPEDLRNVTVHVHFHAGSHYLTLKMLEGFLRKAEIRVDHAPVNENRLAALLNGEVEAITVAEPWMSLAIKHGCRVLCEASCMGSEVASPDIDPQTYAAINRAICKAVSRINQNKKKYLKYFIEEVPRRLGVLRPGDLYMPRLRYVDPEPYPKEEFARSISWMRKHGLINKDASYDRLIDSRITVG